ncbi:MAG TPA: response regulator transcription factor [Anaerolineales bacterium]|nr:response regulator transcription factor [Anaerolineales bacterium]
MKNIRVILVDDHDVVRTGLKTYLDTQSEIEVVGEVGDGALAVELAKELVPDVVIMDISMPGMDGMQATRILKTSCPSCKVLALTVHADKQYFFEMLSAGALGYVTKQAAADELLAAIRAVAAGQVYLQPALATWLLDDYQRLLQQYGASSEFVENKDFTTNDLAVLSNRELQVLALVAESKSNIQIGEILEISPKTVARHRERIMKKLNIHSIVELVRLAIRSGLVTLE